MFADNRLSGYLRIMSPFKRLTFQKKPRCLDQDLDPSCQISVHRGEWARTRAVIFEVYSRGEATSETLVSFVVSLSGRRSGSRVNGNYKSGVGQEVRSLLSPRESIASCIA